MQWFFIYSLEMHVQGIIDVFPSYFLFIRFIKLPTIIHTYIPTEVL